MLELFLIMIISGINVALMVKLKKSPPEVALKSYLGFNLLVVGIFICLPKTLFILLGWGIILSILIRMAQLGKET